MIKILLSTDRKKRKNEKRNQYQIFYFCWDVFSSLHSKTFFCSGQEVQEKRLLRLLNFFTSSWFINLGNMQMSSVKILGMPGIEPMAAESPRKSANHCAILSPSHPFLFFAPRVCSLKRWSYFNLFLIVIAAKFQTVPISKLTGR